MLRELTELNLQLKEKVRRSRERLADSHVHEPLPAQESVDLPAKPIKEIPIAVAREDRPLQRLQRHKEQVHMELHELRALTQDAGNSLIHLRAQLGKPTVNAYTSGSSSREKTVGDTDPSHDDGYFPRLMQLPHKQVPINTLTADVSYMSDEAAIFSSESGLKKESHPTHSDSDASTDSCQSVQSTDNDSDRDSDDHSVSTRTCVHDDEASDVDIDDDNCSNYSVMNSEYAKKQLADNDSIVNNIGAFDDETLEAIDSQSRAVLLRLRDQFDRDAAVIADLQRRTQQLHEHQEELARTKQLLLQTQRHAMTLEKEVRTAKAACVSSRRVSDHEREQMQHSLISLKEDAANALQDAARARQGAAAAFAELRREKVARQRLLHELGELKGRVRVFARVRPLSRDEKKRGDEICVAVPDQFSVKLREQSKSFLFDHVFAGANDSQRTVFDECRNLVELVLTGGRNLFIFAYGQTGSGKTHTIWGDPCLLGESSGNGTADQVNAPCAADRLIDALLAPEWSMQRLDDDLSQTRENLRSAYERKVGTAAGIEPRAVALLFEAARRLQAKQRRNHLADSNRNPVHNTDRPNNANSIDDKDDDFDETGSFIDDVEDSIGHLQTGTPAGNDKRVGDKDDDKEVSIVFSGTMLEVYQGKVYDLFARMRQQPDDKVKLSFAPPGSLTTRQRVVGSTCLRFRSAAECLRAVREAEHCRSRGETRMNEHSSRSHRVFALHITRKCRRTGQTIGMSQLVTTDLAGSERAKKALPTQAALQEARAINKGLSALGLVVKQLGDQSKHVAFRNSTLTSVLQDMFDARARTLMFVTLSPSDYNCAENKSTLDFAIAARRVPADRNAGLASATVRRIDTLERRVGQLQKLLQKHKVAVPPPPLANQGARKKGTKERPKQGRKKKRVAVAAAPNTTQPHFMTSPMRPARSTLSSVASTF